MSYKWYEPVRITDLEDHYALRVWPRWLRIAGSVVGISAAIAVGLALPVPPTHAGPENARECDWFEDGSARCSDGALFDPDTQEWR